MSDEVKALAIRQQSVAVRNVDDLLQFGKMCANSGIIGCENLAQGCMVAHHLHTTGQSLLELASTHHLFSGKLTKRADAMLADLRKYSGSYKVIARTPEEAAIEISCKEASGVFRFTWEEAQTETYPYDKTGKVLKYNWSTPRKRTQMLWARVVSDGVRVCCPEAVAGQYTQDEIQESHAAEPSRASGEIEIPQEEVEVTKPDGKKVEPKAAKPAEKPAEPEATKPEDAAGNEPVDYTCIPIGPKAGTHFSELTLAQLEQVVECDADKYPSVTKKHRANAKNWLKKKEAKEGGEDKNG